MAPFISMRNRGLDLIRVTETAALTASHWIGSGDYIGAHRAANHAMFDALNTLDINGRIAIGEVPRAGNNDLLQTDDQVGSGKGPEVDLIADPIDGTEMLVQGRGGSISLIAMTPRGALWSPTPAQYIEKIVVDRHVAEALVPECLDAPAAWTLALIARVKNKPVRDLSVIILDRTRHHDLISEIRATGAKVWLRGEGDTEGAILAASHDINIDVIMGIGGAAQAVATACAVKALGGEMLARLAPQSDEERGQIREAGLDERQILTVDEMVNTNRVFFAATGITNTRLLDPVDSRDSLAITHSLLVRGKTGTRRFIRAEHIARM